MVKIKTRDKILAEALVQLNEKGLPEVSIRTISNKLGLSSGNLTYHFKNIDVIVYELYLQLIAEMDEHLKYALQKKIELESLGENTEKTFRFLWKYKFLLLDFTAINRRIPKMNIHFRELMAFRKQQFKFVIDQLIERDLLMPEPFIGAYDILIGQLMVFSNAWIQDAELAFEEKEEEAIISYYGHLFKGHLTPYFTKSALQKLRNTQ